MPQTTIMFRPNHVVEHLACFCNRDVENPLLVKQCSAQNRAKSGAPSTAMTKTACYVHSHSNRLVSSILNRGGVPEVYGIIDN